MASEEDLFNTVYIGFKCKLLLPVSLGSGSAGSEANFLQEESHGSGYLQNLLIWFWPKYIYSKLVFAIIRNQCYFYKYNSCGSNNIFVFRTIIIISASFQFKTAILFDLGFRLRSHIKGVALQRTMPTTVFLHPIFSIAAEIK